MLNYYRSENIIENKKKAELLKWLESFQLEENFCDDENENEIEDEALIEMGSLDSDVYKLPIMLCVDKGGTMIKKVKPLVNSINNFIEYLQKKNNSVNNLIELSVISYGKDVEVNLEFSPLYNNYNFKQILAKGGHCLAEAIEQGIENIKKAKSVYRKNGFNLYKPWLIIIADAEYSSEFEHMQFITSKISELINKSELIVLSAISSDDFNYSFLTDLSPGFEPFKITNDNFDGFFEWIEIQLDKAVLSLPKDVDRYYIERNIYW